MSLIWRMESELKREIINHRKCQKGWTKWMLGKLKSKESHKATIVPSTTSSNTEHKRTNSSQKTDLNWPENSTRWRSLYDVCICHSEKDSKYALQMLLYLEAQPEKLRCFLPMRDMAVGSPIPSEMCHGVRSSHCWVMLLTPHFLSDAWCTYQMHQALAESPHSGGRLIPVMMSLPRTQYPVELKFMYYINAMSDDECVFNQIRNSILLYLKKLRQVTNDEMQRRSHDMWEKSSETNMSGSSIQRRSPQMQHATEKKLDAGVQQHAEEMQ
ncbi:toll/interleukin-1 receptor domain-containing adapter protein isoform X2 [Ascaphus truei]|uniref:toll/interleukin-1 receptor domain-containing adapter protein isoform X2 n=1 Tax=Ascaphus truei TaxID=8439 RepID=UPI003F59A848